MDHCWCLGLRLGFRTICWPRGGGRTSRRSDLERLLMKDLRKASAATQASSDVLLQGRACSEDLVP